MGAWARWGAPRKATKKEELICVLGLYYLERILLPAAVIPAVVLLVKIYKADKREKEPPELLASLVIYGVLATALAIFAERLGGWLLPRLMQPNTLAYQAVEYFVVVGLSEEAAKYLLLKRRTWNSPAFNYTFDGVVYAAFVSLGFALWENISYVMMYGLETALVRAVTAVPGHACFGVLMGALYGAAKKYEGLCQEGRMKACRFLAVACPALIHGGYDFLASLGGNYEALFFAYIAVLFLGAFLLVRRLSREDEFIQGSRYW